LKVPPEICAATRRALSDYLDGQPLSPWRALTVRLHSRLCPGCRPIYRSLRETKRALAALRDRDALER